MSKTNNEIQEILLKQSKGGNLTKHHAKKNKTDALLREMVLNSDPGDTFTLEEIAQYVGVTRERIRQIEFGALRKLRPKLKRMFENDGVWGEI